MPAPFDFIIGDSTGLNIPAHPDALQQAGPDFLTQAFHNFGALAADNRVTAIRSIQPCPGGSTGRKLFILLDTLKPERGFDQPLFVKFSRDFDDERRDWQKTEMASEALFTPLTRLPDFPIRVPCGHFADYHAATGTGLVITESVAYGQNGIEPHRRKCLDHQTMDQPLDYYRATVTALARLAGAHKSGQLGADIATRFAWDKVTGTADPIRYSADELAAELDRCFAFHLDCPQLLPAVAQSGEFIAQMVRDAQKICQNEAAIQAELTGNPDMIALNHWNAHIDNCWFWRDADGLHCGLIDWGRVGQITLGSALWGGLSAAHHDIWDYHLDDLLGLFCDEYAKAGGPVLALADLQRHLALHMAVMGVARVLAFPEIIRFRLPECSAAAGPRDTMFEAVSADPARNCLSVYSVFINHWQRMNFGGLINRV